ncbi:hypothetical protein HYFRA_00012354 [Hymenoscyphus fraxineus]|uniref:Fibronectin type-III domain-containing protein n=1 Tax=Hymenoscyphus fraxineus TaxID=746836 RepID=A0A9N9PKB4_9HELO|nr:hypothetical protein HYFRA_00012354 [Hymenoscyphus fraxineus]
MPRNALAESGAVERLATEQHREEYNNSVLPLDTEPPAAIASLPPPPPPAPEPFLTLQSVLTEVSIVILAIVAAYSVCSYFDQFEILRREKRLYSTLWMNAQTFWRENWLWTVDHVTEGNMFILQSVVTCGALFWLLHRAWMTLWKPVPELISILGVEVPDSPEVSLAGIAAENITLRWTRPGANKPVVKYLIQVNGVNVGESSRLETAITVTGLKPGHFYNVRVIAVGSNNFQAGSRVIRLRTYGKDGRPQLDNGRMPSNVSMEDQSSDSGEESTTVRTHSAGVEAATTEPCPPTTREPSSSVNVGQRRNTVSRKHSPSNAATDQAALAAIASNQPEETMQQLTEKFEAIRRDTEEVMGQVARDSEEYKIQILDLMKEKDEKRKALKEKEEASEKLKKEVNYSERSNRQAQNRKQQKEKVLKEKQNERAKMQADVARWRKEIDEMKAEREKWQKEKDELLKNKEQRAKELRETIRKRQNSVDGLDQVIRLKGLQIKELEAARKTLPGGEDDDESRAIDAAEKQRDLEWEMREKDLVRQLNSQQVQLRQLEVQYHNAQNTYNALGARLANNPLANNPLMYHGNSSGVDFDPASQGKAKARRTRNRKSRNGTVSSPVPGFAIMDSQYPNNPYNTMNNTASPSFAPGPYFDLNHDTAMVPLAEQTIGMSEAEVRAMTAGAPLSPTATSLLPSNIFSDDDRSLEGDNSPRFFGGALHGTSQSAFDHDFHSPTSSRSASRVSSPQASSHNLTKYGVSSHDHALDNERRSLNSPRNEFGAIGSPSPSHHPSSHNKFTNLFGFPKSRAKTTPHDSPALGSLKSGQSQSFPRSTDEPEVMANRQRRVSFTSGWNVMPSLFNRGSVSDAIEGNAPAPARNPTARRRRLNMFGSSIDDPISYSERDPSSPRPVSIASSDLPRPSTDSAPFGWPAAEGNIINRNSPLATNWSVNVTQPWSRTPSRRPSLQYSNSNPLTSGIASDDDEFLPSDLVTGQGSPPPVGVIGTRPASAHKPVTPRLNPAAPTFRAMFSRSGKAEREQENTEPASESRGSTADSSHHPFFGSPSELRKSRDTRSIRTQNSVAESSESLDIITSNTPSDVMSGNAKDKDTSFTRRLLRKGSSSKFSLSSIRGKDSNLFSSKKGTSVTADSDRAERDGSIDLGDDSQLGKSYESATSSPMLGSMPSGEWSRKDPGTPKEGRMGVNWSRALGFKKGKGRESSDVDRSEADTTGPED